MAHPRRPGKLPLPTSWMAGLLAIKLIWAFGYTYLYFHLYPASSDSWGYFDQSRQLAHLIHTPADFFRLALPIHGHWTDIFHYDFWNNLKENLYVLLILGMNLVTGHNPYLDTLLYALLTFTGWVRLIRLLVAYYPGLEPWWYCVPFLLPTFLFCYSGLHSDGLIFTLLGWFAWDAYRLFVLKDKPSLARFLLLCFLLACFKAFLFAFLLTLLVAWWLVYRRGIPIVYGWICLVALDVAVFLLTIPEQVSRQHLYLQLHYTAFLPDPPLEGSLKGYLGRFPRAAWSAFFRPAPWELAQARYIWSGLEVWGLWALWLYGLFRRVRRPFFLDSWLLLTVSLWLLIGYTIPILSAIVRYRALLFPFVLAFCLLPLLISRDGSKRFTQKLL